MKRILLTVALSLGVGLFCESRIAAEPEGAPDATDLRPYEGAETITASFAGSNLRLLTEYLVRADEAAKKGEFETTTEHQARLADLKTAIAPVDPNKFYAIPLDGITADYDADRQVWQVRNRSTRGCSPYPSRPTLFECLSVSSRTTGSTYLGQNSYGATAEIENIAYNDIKFMMASDWPKVREVFKQGPFGDYNLDLSIPMPIDEARAYAGSEFEVYAVGSIISPWISRARPERFAPTISDPTRTVIRSISLPMLAQELIVVAKGHAGAVAVVSLSGKELMIP